MPSSSGRTAPRCRHRRSRGCPPRRTRGRSRRRRSRCRSRSRPRRRPESPPWSRRPYWRAPRRRLTPTAREVYAQLRKNFNTQYDDAQSIGRRYRRQDEIGTPYCVTIDFDTLDDHQVTIRDRDTMSQSRIPIDHLVEVLRDKLEHGW